MKNGKIYFLDRNVISIIKDYNTNKELSEKKQNQISELKSKDKEENIISIFPSVWEGEIGKLQSPEQKRETIEKESEEVSKFFKKAKVDGLNLLKFPDLDSALSENVTEKVELWKELFLKLNEKLYQPIKSHDREEVFNEIMEFCRKKNMPYHHLVVELCVANLYGNEVACKILKFKKNCFNPYNAICDIYLILNVMKFIIEHRKKSNFKIEWSILTFDNALKMLIDNINIPDDGLDACMINGKKVYTLKHSFKEDIFDEMPENIKNIYNKMQY